MLFNITWLVVFLAVQINSANAQSTQASSIAAKAPKYLVKRLISLTEFNPSTGPTTNNKLIKPGLEIIISPVLQTWNGIEYYIGLVSVSNIATNADLTTGPDILIGSTTFINFNDNSLSWCISKSKF